MLLKEYLTRFHITQKGFAEDLGMSYVGFRKVLSGQVDTSLSVAFKIKKLTKGKVQVHDIYKAWLIKKDNESKKKNNTDH